MSPVLDAEVAHVADMTLVRRRIDMRTAGGTVYPTYL
jgi:hypothetical protein